MCHLLKYLSKTQGNVFCTLFYCLCFYTGTKRSHRDQTIAGENENHSQSNRSEERVVTGEETETQPLMTQENVQMEVLNEVKAAIISPEVHMHVSLCGIITYLPL